jgi:hypothetical protein
MVAHCVKKPDEAWMYPRDWDLLLGVVGGRAVQRKEHTDRASFTRWKDVVAPPPGKGVLNTLLEAHKREEKEKRAHKVKGEGGEALASKRRKKEKEATPREVSAAPSTGGTPVNRQHSPTLQATPASGTLWIGGTPIPEPQQPAKKKRARPLKNSHD